MSAQSHVTADNLHRTALRVEVFSDVVCPWCYIGKRRLEQALERVKGMNDPHVIWRPFQLNPAMPSSGMDRTVYLEAKLGGPEALRSMQDRVAAVGAREGIEFAFDRIQRTPNTFDAHRLIWYAEQKKKQDEVVEELFRAYFVEGLDLGSLEVLASIAGRSGLDAADASRFLKSNEGEAAVREEEREGHRLGIRGVPHFILNERLAISGAQPFETFLSAVEQLKNESDITRG